MTINDIGNGVNRSGNVKILNMSLTIQEFITLIVFEYSLLNK